MRDTNTARQKIAFIEHVRELRRRLAWSAAIFMVGGLVGYVYHGAIISFLRHPLHSTLYYDSPVGNFNLIMEISALTGLFLCLPVLVFNIIRFIEPAVEKRLKHRHLMTAAGLAMALAAVGAIFAFLVVLPMSLHFFQGFKIEGVKALISASNYLNFVIKCLATFMIIFQLPLLMLFINFIRPIKPGTLLKYEKHVVVASLIVALVLPFTYDPITQFAIALPIILLYNLSLVLVWGVNRQPRTEPLPRQKGLQPTPYKPPQPRPIKPIYASPIKPVTTAKPRPQLITDMVGQSRMQKPSTRPLTASLRTTPKQPVHPKPVTPNMSGRLISDFVGHGPMPSSYLLPKSR